MNEFPFGQSLMVNIPALIHAFFFAFFCELAHFPQEYVRLAIWIH